MSNIEEYNYPNIKDENAINRIYHKKEFNDYVQSQESDDNTFSFFNKKNLAFALFPHQLVLKHFMSPHTPYRSMLLYHSTGSGKTCTAIQISEQYKDQIRSYGNRVLIITSDRLKEEYQKQLTATYHNENPTKSNCVRGIYENDADLKGEKTIEKYADYARYYEFYTYEMINKFITDEFKKDNWYERLQVYFSYRLIIIDEFHLYKNVENKKQDNELQAFRTNILKVLMLSKHSKILLMSATPIIDNIIDLRFIINAFHACKMTIKYENNKIQPTNKFFLFMDDEKELSLYEQFENFVFTNDNGKIQFKKYMYLKGKLNKRRIFKLLRNQVSYILKQFDIDIKTTDDHVDWSPVDNYVFPYKLVPTVMDDKHRQAFLEYMGNRKDTTSKSNEILINNTLLSPHQSNKLEKLKKYIEDGWTNTDEKGNLSREKIFISTSLITGVVKNKKGILIDLMKELGYEEFRGKTLPSEKRKRYMIVAGTDIKAVVDKLDKTYNQPENRYGDYIQILIGSDVLNVGVTLRCVRQTHLIYINSSYSVETMDQIMGRSVRADSHSQFQHQYEKYTKQFVHVHVYNNENINKKFERKKLKKWLNNYNKKSYNKYPYDLYTYLQAFHKYIKNKEITDFLARIAFDCNLTENRVRCIEDDCKEPFIDVKCYEKVEIKDEIDESTYRFDHVEGKLGYIIDAIKTIIYRNFISSIENIIKLINDKRPPYIKKDEVKGLVETALEEMVPSDVLDIRIFKHLLKREIITNENGDVEVKYGYLARRGNIVYFEFPDIVVERVSDTKLLERLVKQEQMMIDVFSYKDYFDYMSRPVEAIQTFQDFIQT